MTIINNELIFNLNCAIQHDDTDLIVTLLKDINENNVNEYDVKGFDKRRLIDVAAEFATPDVLALILDKKPNLDEPNDETGLPPVHLALTRDSRGTYKESFEKIFELLYLAGANFRVKEKVTGFSLVHFALKENKPELIYPLVKQCGCDINASDNQGRTPLVYAKEKYSMPHFIFDDINALGGKEFNDATQELHDFFNKDLEKYFKYAKRYPVKFRYSNLEKPEATKKTEIETPQENISNSDLSKYSIFSDKAQKIRELSQNTIISTHVNAILSAKDKKLYEVLLRNLKTKTNKDEIISAIINECKAKTESMQNKIQPKNLEIYHQIMKQLEETTHPLKEESNLEMAKLSAF